MKPLNCFQAACDNASFCYDPKDLIRVSTFLPVKRKKLNPSVFVVFLFILVLNPFYGQAQVTLSNYKTEAQKSGANYYQLVREVRAKLELKNWR